MLLYADMNALERNPDKAIGMHWHAYQPIREDADGIIRGEGQDASKGHSTPVADYNHRQVEQTYRPQLEAGNVERVSFNVFPNLAYYLEANFPKVYDRLKVSTRAVQERGEPLNAVGSPFFHAIMPLLPDHDQDTLLAWGKRDFEKRYGQKATGLWLPELAVNSTVLQKAQEHGFKFTFAMKWQLDGFVGTPTAYNVPLQNGHMTVLADRSFDSWAHWFWNKPHENVFEEVETIFTNEPVPQMGLKATDFEAFKKRDGRVDMIREVSTAKGRYPWLTPTTFLAENRILEGAYDIPQAAIKENSAGEGTNGGSAGRTLERWTGMRGSEVVVPWKYQLQLAYQQFSENLDTIYTNKTEELGIEAPFELRNDYIDIVIGATTPDDYFAKWAPTLGGPDRKAVLQLLASQYHKLAAATSCGWFFDKATGREPRIVARQMKIATEHVKAAGLEAEARALEEQTKVALLGVVDNETNLAAIYEAEDVSEAGKIDVPQVAARSQLNLLTE